MFVLELSPQIQVNGEYVREVSFQCKFTKGCVNPLSVDVSLSTALSLLANCLFSISSQYEISKLPLAKVVNRCFWLNAFVGLILGSTVDNFCQIMSFQLGSRGLTRSILWLKFPQAGTFVLIVGSPFKFQQLYIFIV